MVREVCGLCKALEKAPKMEKAVPCNLQGSKVTTHIVRTSDSRERQSANGEEAHLKVEVRG